MDIVEKTGAENRNDPNDSTFHFMKKRLQLLCIMLCYLANVI